MALQHTPMPTFRNETMLLKIQLAICISLRIKLSDYEMVKMCRRMQIAPESVREGNERRSVFGEMRNVCRVKWKKKNIDFYFQLCRSSRNLFIYYSRCDGDAFPIPSRLKKWRIKRDANLNVEDFNQHSNDDILPFFIPPPMPPPSTRFQMKRWHVFDIDFVWHLDVNLKKAFWIEKENVCKARIRTISGDYWSLFRPSFCTRDVERCVNCKGYFTVGQVENWPMTDSCFVCFHSKRIMGWIYVVK